MRTSLMRTSDLAPGSPAGRRTFLRAALAGLTWTGSGLCALAQTRAVPPQHPLNAAGPEGGVRSLPLTPRVTLLTADGANIVVFNGDDGVLMVNGGPRERSNEVLAAVNALASSPYVRGLFNTDWHPEHTGCNDALGQSRARIIAHANTKLWMSTEIVQAWRQRTFAPRARTALPTQTFYTSGSLEFAGERVEYGHLPQAHTDGDIYVFFRGANVLVAGDVVSTGSYPVLDYSTGGWIGGLTDGTKVLLDLANADTRIVPGSGRVQTRADLQAQHAMLVEVRGRLVQLLKKGMSARDMIAAAPTKEFDVTWGNPDLFISNAYRGLWGHVRELGGIV